MESLILCNQHSCSNSAFFIFCPGKTLFCALEGKMIPFLQLLHSSGLWLLTRAYCPLSLQLCVSSPVEIRLHHKMETQQRLVFCDLTNKQGLNLRLTASPPCITFPFRLQFREIFSMRNIWYLGAGLFICLFSVT